MYLQEPIIRINDYTGQQTEVLDVRAVKRNFDSIRQESEQTDNNLNQLHMRLMKLEQFMKFCWDNYPEVTREFSLVEATKVRVGAVKSPPPILSVEENMEQQRQALLAQRRQALAQAPNLAGVVWHENGVKYP